MQLLGFPRCHLSSTMSHHGRDHCGHHGCCGCGRGDHRVHRGRVPMDARTRALPCHLPSPCKKSKTCVAQRLVRRCNTSNNVLRTRTKKYSPHYPHHNLPHVLVHWCYVWWFKSLQRHIEYQISLKYHQNGLSLTWWIRTKKKLTWKAGPPLCPPLVGRVLLAATRHVWRKAPNMTTTI